MGVLTALVACRDATIAPSPSEAFQLSDFRPPEQREETSSDAEISEMSDGVAVVDPADERPAQPELNACEASDEDGDGYGTHPSCDALDCNDAIPEINPAQMERCNGVDDDCDQSVDEEAQGALCGVGVCVRSAECQDGQPTACVPGEPTREICNGVDDDCDGQTDESLGLEIVATNLETLRMIDPDCNAREDLADLSCRRAIEGFCLQNGCGQTGFVPVERDGDDFSVVCLPHTRVPAHG